MNTTTAILIGGALGALAYFFLKPSAPASTPSLGQQLLNSYSSTYHDYFQDPLNGPGFQP